MLTPLLRARGRTAVNGVIAEAHGGRSLGDLREPVGIVIGIGHLRLAGDGHAGMAAGQVLSIRNLPLRRGFSRLNAHSDSQ